MYYILPVLYSIVLVCVCVCSVLTVITDLWLMWYCPCLLLIIMQVHIHPIITPTNTTKSSPVADPSITSPDALAGDVLAGDVLVGDALDGVVIASLGVLHGLLGSVQGAGVVLVVVFSQLPVWQEHCSFAVSLVALNVMLQS